MLHLRAAYEARSLIEVCISRVNKEGRYRGKVSAAGLSHVQMLMYIANFKSFENV
jgi:hypothetical protein